MSDARLEPAAVPGTPVVQTDEELLAGLAAGRLEALDALYERYKTMAYGIARRITGDDSLAEDVVQEAFLGAWRSADRYVTGRGSVKTWLLSIVHHRAIDAVRRRRPASELPEEAEGMRTPEPLTLPDVWGEVSGRLDASAVQAALAALPALQRQALELAYFGGLSQTEMATQLGVPLGTVKSRVRLALVSMRRELGLSVSPDLGAAEGPP
jgi:RNA polymerase sigma-70 factor (ECF subfamily)